MAKKAVSTEEELAQWVEARKEAVKKAAEACTDIEMWMTRFESYGRDEVRRAQREKYIREHRRKIA